MLTVYSSTQQNKTKKNPKKTKQTNPKPPPNSLPLPFSRSL